VELRRRLVRAAVSRPGVLLAVCPGATRERLAVEAELVRRGWPCVAVPADADLLVIAGAPGAEASDWLANVWGGVPAPKFLVRITDAEQAAAALDHGMAELGRGGSQGPSAHDGHDGHTDHADHGAGEEQADHHRHGGGTPHPGHDGHAAHEAVDHAHNGHAEHGGHSGRSGYEMHGEHGEHGEHGGEHEMHSEHDMHSQNGEHGRHDMHGGHHSHAGHDMGVVDGLPMADRADDRDGLRLDRLHVPLGPALADWPAGLVLRLALQGDIVQEVAVEPTAAPASPRPPFWNEPWLRAAAGERVSQGDAARRLCAAHLDSLGRFFAVTGWADMAARTRYVRDRALAGADAAELSALVRPLIRRAEHSRTLRWLTSGLGLLPAEHAHHLGVTGPALVADGDAHSRMLGWLEAVGRNAAACDETEALDVAQVIAQVVGPRGRVDGRVPPSQALLDVLPSLLEGTEFACARIIVASLDPDLDEFTPVPATGTVHG